MCFFPFGLLPPPKVQLLTVIPNISIDMRDPRGSLQNLEISFVSDGSLDILLEIPGDGDPWGSQEIPRKKQKNTKSSPTILFHIYICRYIHTHTLHNQNLYGGLGSQLQPYEKGVLLMHFTESIICMEDWGHNSTSTILFYMQFIESNAIRAKQQLVVEEYCSRNKANKMKYKRNVKP